jgi:hypothetical protein
MQIPFPVASLLYIDPSERPILTAVVDAEEEFDWSAPFNPNNTSVSNIAEQFLSQAIFDSHGMVPTYVIDYPVAANSSSRETLRRIADDGRCEIGAHLHPWVSPPYEGPIDAFNSFPGNLPVELERRKLEVLTEAIFAGFERQVLVYKAGRYGLGAATLQILVDLGYHIDVSIVPYTDFSRQQGPDFRAYGPWPFRFGPSLVELPLSVGFAGRLGRHGPELYPALSTSWGMKLRLPGIASRISLLERIRLSPEGHSLEDMKRLTCAALAEGQRFFMLTYHSSSLLPAANPYVRNSADRQVFLDRLDGYLRFFLGHCGGRTEKISTIGLAGLATEGDSPLLPHAELHSETAARCDEAALNSRPFGARHARVSGSRCLLRHKL